MKILLENHRTKGSKIFTGRDRGKFVRQESKIDELEKCNYEIIIVIPDNLYSINPSFFEELFVNVVSKLGKKISLINLNLKTLEIIITKNP